MFQFFVIASVTLKNVPIILIEIQKIMHVECISLDFHLSGTNNKFSLNKIIKSDINIEQKYNTKI